MSFLDHRAGIDSGASRSHRSPCNCICGGGKQRLQRGGVGDPWRLPLVRLHSGSGTRTRCLWWRLGAFALSPVGADISGGRILSIALCNRVDQLFGGVRFRVP